MTLGGMALGCAFLWLVRRSLTTERLESSWLNRLSGEFSEPYMTQLRQFLLERKRSGAVVYPPGNQIFIKKKPVLKDFEDELQRYNMAKSQLTTEATEYRWVHFNNLIN